MFSGAPREISSTASQPSWHLNIKTAPLCRHEFANVVNLYSQVRLIQEIHYYGLGWHRKYTTAMTFERMCVQLRGSSRERITFLVNWWKTKPMGPNCNKITTKLVKHLGVYDREGVEALLASAAVKNHVAVPAQKVEMVVPVNRVCVCLHTHTHTQTTVQESRVCCCPEV